VDRTGCSLLGAHNPKDSSIVGWVEQTEIMGASVVCPGQIGPLSVSQPSIGLRPHQGFARPRPALRESSNLVLIQRRDGLKSPRFYVHALTVQDVGNLPNFRVSTNRALL